MWQLFIFEGAFFTPCKMEALIFQLYFIRKENIFILQADKTVGLNHSSTN